MIWTVRVTDDFTDWLATLEPATRRRVLATVDLLKERGPALPRPHADTIEGSRHSNMKELRPTLTVRVLFAFDPNRQAILLVGGDKKSLGNRWYRRAIRRADDLYDEHLKELQEQQKEPS